MRLASLLFGGSCFLCRGAAGGVLTVTIPRVKDRRGREIIIPVRREETS